MATQMQQAVNVSTEALDVKSIKSIQLSDGWHQVESCELVQFAVGVAQSPISPQKLYPTLRYRDKTSGAIVRTPISNILSFSEERVS
jgi:hypothetical protein